MGQIREAADAWNKVKQHHVIDHPTSMRDAGMGVVEDDELDTLFTQTLQLDGDELVAECDYYATLALLAMLRVGPREVIKGILAEGIAVGITLERERSGTA